MNINDAALKSLYTGFNASFQGAFDAHKPEWMKVATLMRSTTLTNEYGWLGQLSRFREWIGDRVIKSIANHGYTLRNRKFENTIGVSKDSIEDDNIGMYAPLFADMGQAAAEFPDELVFPLLPGGFTTPCYDGQNFFDTDHPVLDVNGNEQSVSNMTAGASAPWYLLDTTRPIKPLIYQERKPFNRLVRKDQETDDNVFDRDEYVYGSAGRANAGYGFWQMAHGSKAALDATAYEAARVAMRNLKGDMGRPLKMKPKLLVVPPSLEGAALEIVQSQLVNGGETNKWAGTAEVFVSDYLA